MMKKILLILLCLPMIGLGQNWTQIGQDIYGDFENIRLGDAVSINFDGDRIVTGIPFADQNGSNSGQAKTFTLENLTNWSSLLENDINGQGWQDNAGAGVNMSADGTTIAIGSPGSNSDEEGFNSTGHVTIYRLHEGVFSDYYRRLGCDILGEFGESSGRRISLSSNGNIIAIGVPNSGDGNDQYTSGSVRVYQYIPTQDPYSSDPDFCWGSWVQLGDDIDGQEFNYYMGTSISIDSAGNTLAIGSRLHVDIYDYLNGSWNKDQGLSVVSDFEWHSVSLSSDGNTVAIGSHNSSYAFLEQAGLVKIYQKSLISWNQIGSDILGDLEGDAFGYSISLSSDGNTLVIGAPFNNEGNGKVEIYNYQNASWNQIGDDILGENNFGRKLSLSGNGKTFVVGMPYAADLAGRVQVYQSPIGCMDNFACNYNPPAVVSDNSCVYRDNSFDMTEENWILDYEFEMENDVNHTETITFIPDGSIMGWGSTTWSLCDGVLTMSSGYSVFTGTHAYIVNDLSSQYGPGAVQVTDIVRFTGEINSIAGAGTWTMELELNGCTDSLALNYNMNANIDDGTCEYPIPGCTEEQIIISEIHTNTNTNSFSYSDYIELQNVSDSDCNLEGWRLDNSFAFNDFTFPSAIIPSQGFWSGATPVSSNSSTRDSLGNHHQTVVGNFSFDLNEQGGDNVCLGGPTNSILLSVNNQPSNENYSQSFNIISDGCYTNPTPYSPNDGCLYGCPDGESVYTFIINDVFGDGMCCEWGEGSYSVSANGMLMVSGAEFEYIETTSFCAPPNSCFDIEIIADDYSDMDQSWEFLDEDNNQLVSGYDEGVIGCVDCVNPDPPLVMCEDVYDPVCGCDGITYQNSCIALVEGASSWVNGPCSVLGCIDESATNYNADATVDDGSCEYPVGCSDPVNLSTSELLTNVPAGAQVRWNWEYPGTEDVNYYYIRYKEVGGGWSIAGLGSNDGVAMTQTSKLQLGLLAATDYEWQARAYCINGEVSNWSLSDFYTTTAECPEGTDLATSNIEGSWATLDWSNGELSGDQYIDHYLVRYSVDNGENWQWKGGMEANTNTILGFLPTESDIQWQVKSFCNGNNYYRSDWTDANVFTTEFYPNTPTNLTTTPSDNPWFPATNYVTYNWDVPQGPSPHHYIIRYVENSDPGNLGAWAYRGTHDESDANNFLDGATTSKFAGGLQTGGSYAWGVRAFHTTGVIYYGNVLGLTWKSDWSDMAFFTTPAGERVANAVTDLDVYPNPSRDVFNVTFSSEQIQNITIKVINVIGEEVYTETLKEFTGQYTKAIDLKQQSKGVYTLQITTESGGVNKKIVLQ